MEERGLAPRSIDYVFKEIEKNKRFRWIYNAFLSIQEIYLENVIDLIRKENIKEK